jgi:hypothetical protein
MGWSELEGIANRTDFDLRRHSEFSGEKLEYVDTATGERYIPYVIEPSAGADRATLAFMVDAYDEEEVAGRGRTVLRLHPRLAPVKVAVLPLVSRDGMPEKARALYEELRQRVPAEFDEGGSIGKRYRRQDEIGTPWGVTIDGQTLEDETVTLRDRDSLEQIRISTGELGEELERRGERVDLVLVRSHLHRDGVGEFGVPADIAYDDASSEGERPEDAGRRLAERRPAKADANVRASEECPEVRVGDVTERQHVPAESQTEPLQPRRELEAVIARAREDEQRLGEGATETSKGSQELGDPLGARHRAERRDDRGVGGGDRRGADLGCRRGRKRHRPDWAVVALCADEVGSKAGVDDHAERIVEDPGEQWDVEGSRFPERW